MVKRVWEQLFGAGLAETLEDLELAGYSITFGIIYNWLSYQFLE